MIENTFTTDWLNSIPVFYNQYTRKVSYNINDVIDYSNIELHPEGLFNYMDFGYSVFGQTPVDGVRFLPPNSSIYEMDGILQISEKPEYDQVTVGSSNVEDVLDLIHAKVQKWQKSIPENESIIVPLSGGYDSRLLASMLQPDDRVKAYTYSNNYLKERSYEIVLGKEVAERLNIPWNSIILDKTLDYIGDWYDLYGSGTHAHGMYHMKFYDEILSQSGSGSILHGIVGDAWSGHVGIPDIKSPNDLVHLGLTHKMRANPNSIRIDYGKRLREQYFEENKHRLQQDELKIIECIRLKMILLSYLFKVPESRGFTPWSPFVDREVALSMLALPDKKKENRIWQQEYFQKIGLDVENSSLEFRPYTKHSYRALLKEIKLPLLQKELLSKYIDERYLEWINKNIRRSSIVWDMYHNLYDIRVFNRIHRMIGVKDERRAAFNAWRVLWPLNELMSNRKN